MREQNYSPEPVRDALWNLTHPAISGTVLDAGSGEGEWIKRLQTIPAITRLISVDINEAWAKSAGVESYQCNLARDPLPLENLDWIFAIEVLEHLENPRHFIREAARCLKPGGKLAVTTPSNECLTARLSYLFRGFFPAFADQSYHATGHIYPVTELDLTRMSKEAGFSKVEFHYPTRGRMPKLPYEWQSVFPFLKGKPWSDTMIAILTY